MKKLSHYLCLIFLLIGSLQLYGSDAYLSDVDAAFVEAVKAKRLDKIEELLEEGANVHTPIPYSISDCDWDRDIESSALLYAIRRNLPEMVKILIKVDNHLNEALFEAIQEKRSEIVEELIKGGADVNCVNDFGETPLLSAVGRYSTTLETEKIIQTLLEAGSDVTHADKWGKTALMKTVIDHDLNTVEKLLQIPEIMTGSFFGFGTKPINYADADGNTALMLAIIHVQYTYFDTRGYNYCVNSQQILKLLLNTPGIDLHHVNNKGKTAITLLNELKSKIRPYSY